jgi:hypothetical protein
MRGRTDSPGLKFCRHRTARRFQNPRIQYASCRLRVNGRFIDADSLRDALTTPTALSLVQSFNLTTDHDRNQRGHIDVNVDVCD